MKIRIARWAWRKLVAPHVVTYRWSVRGSLGNIYAADVWAIDPADVEVVLSGRPRSARAGR